MRLRQILDAILPTPAAAQRKVTMAGKDWDEYSLADKVTLERATRRILDTGTEIIIVHATWLQGRAVNRDRYLGSFQFVK